MPVMTETERKVYESRPFKAYDRDGNVVAFKHLVDKRQAMETFGLTENPPGQEQPKGGNPFKDYESKSTEEVVTLCIARNIHGYMLMNKTDQIAALRAVDQRDFDDRKALNEAKAETPKASKKEK